MSRISLEFYEKGAATLVTAVVLLLAVLGVTFFMSETVITEKQLAADEFRAKQAFHAANAGLDHGIAYLTVGKDQDDDGAVDNLVVSGATAVGVASYVASLADVSEDGDGALVAVVALGSSDDGSVQRKLTQVFGELPALPNPPAVPVVAKGTVGVSGNLSVTNNSENGALTIWTGDKVSNWGSSNTYIKIDGQENQLSTTKDTRGPDVIDGDQNLANATEAEIIENFFGYTDGWNSISEASENYDFDIATDDASDAAGKLVYSDSDITINGGVWGSQDNPVIIAVEGELTLSGGPEIYGVILAESIVKAAGTPVIHGGIIATSDVNFGAGNVSVIFDETVMDNVDKIFTLGSVPGSWKDWD